MKIEKFFSIPKNNCLWVEEYIWMISKNFHHQFLSTPVHIWARLCICTAGSYASLSVCLSKCLSNWTKIRTRQKVIRQKIISRKPFNCKSVSLWASLGLLQIIESLASVLTSTSSCIFCLQLTGAITWDPGSLSSYVAPCHQHLSN